MQKIDFLHLQDVIDIHEDQLKQFGGLEGIRDEVCS